MKRGLQRSRSLLEGILCYQWMRKPGSQRVLFLRSTMEVTADAWRSALCLWKIDSSGSLSQNASKYLHRCLVECLSAHVHMSIHICHSCPFFLVIVQLCLLCFLWAVSLLPALSHCLTSSVAFLPPLPPSLHSPRSKHVSPPQQVSRGPLWGNTPRVCFISEHVSACLRSQQWLRKLLQNKAATKVPIVVISTIQTGLTHLRLPENLF